MEQIKILIENLTSCNQLLLSMGVEYEKEYGIHFNKPNDNEDISKSIEITKVMKKLSQAESNLIRELAIDYKIKLDNNNWMQFEELANTCYQYFVEESFRLADINIFKIFLMSAYHRSAQNIVAEKEKYIFKMFKKYKQYKFLDKFILLGQINTHSIVDLAVLEENDELINYINLSELKYSVKFTTKDNIEYICSRRNIELLKSFYVLTNYKFESSDPSVNVIHSELLRNITKYAWIEGLIFYKEYTVFDNYNIDNKDSYQNIINPYENNKIDFLEFEFQGSGNSINAMYDDSEEKEIKYVGAIYNNFKIHGVYSFLISIYENLYLHNKSNVFNYTLDLLFENIKKYDNEKYLSIKRDLLGGKLTDFFVAIEEQNTDKEYPESGEIKKDNKINDKLLALLSFYRIYKEKDLLEGTIGMANKNNINIQKI